MRPPVPHAPAHCQTVQTMQGQPARKSAVRALPWQAAILDDLYEQVQNPSKKQRKKAASETGLSEEWVKNWFSRQQKCKRKGPILHSMTSRNPPLSDVPLRMRTDNLPHTSSFRLDPSLPFPFYHPHETGRSLVYDAETDKTIAMIPRPIPATSNIPITRVSSAPDAVASSSSPVPIHSARTDTRSRAQSPSLGYIPSAFPLYLFEAEPTAPIGGNSQPGPSQRAPSENYDQRRFSSQPPEISTFLTPSLTEDFRTSAIYSELAVPTLTPLVDEAGHHLPFGLPTEISFASVQSRSTSAYAGSHDSSKIHCPPHPCPVFYTTRLSDVTAMARQARNRTRSTSARRDHLVRKEEVASATTSESVN